MGSTIRRKSEGHPPVVKRGPLLLRDPQKGNISISRYGASRDLDFPETLDPTVNLKP